MTPTSISVAEGPGLLLSSDYQLWHVALCNVNLQEYDVHAPFQSKFRHTAGIQFSSPVGVVELIVTGTFTTQVLICSTCVVHTVHV